MCAGTAVCIWATTCPSTSRYIHVYIHTHNKSFCYTYISPSTKLTSSNLPLDIFLVSQVRQEAEFFCLTQCIRWCTSKICSLEAKASLDQELDRQFKQHILSPTPLYIHLSLSLSLSLSFPILDSPLSSRRHILCIVHLEYYPFYVYSFLN